MTDRDDASEFHPAALTSREALLFEAGIKLGGVFHQYVGMPVAPRTAKRLARTIEEAVALQPFVVRVRVTIDTEEGGPVGPGRFGYRYLTPEMLHVRVVLRDARAMVAAELRHAPELRYPLMRVTEARSKERPATAARRSART